MAKVGKPGSGGFVGRLAALRQAKDPNKAGDAPALRQGPAPAAAGQLGAPLAEAGVDDKLIRRFGRDLRGAVGGLAKIATAGAGLEAWQAKSFDRVLKQSHKILGMLLGALPAEQRPLAAQTTADAWAKLATRPDLGSKLPFVLASAAGLVDSAVRMEARRKLDFTPEQLASVAESSVAQIEALLDEAAGRDGLVTMLNVLPRLVEELELSGAGLGADARAALVGDVRRFMQDALPRSGVTLADASDLARALSVTVRKHPGAPARVLKAAKEDFVATRAEALAAAQAAIGDAPDPALEPAFGALRATLAANPAGPASLFEAAPRLKDVFVNLLQRAGADAGRRGALDALARFVEGAKDTPSAEGALRLVEKLGPHLVTRPELAAALAEAARAGDEGEIARGVYAAIQGLFPRAAGTPWDQAQGTLAELSPSEAAKVAFAHAQVADRAQSDGDLVWGLARQVKAGAQSSAAELTSFANRWAQAMEQVPANPQRGAVLAAVVGNSQGDAIDVNRIRNATNTLQQITRFVPDGDPSALLAPGPDGSPGLWALTDPAAGWATQPTYILQQLLQAAQGAPGDAGALAHLAMKVAQSAAYIQQGQNIQVPRIVADFGAAAKDPAALKGVAGPKGQVALRAQAAKPSLHTFVEDHAALPVDFVFTAGVHLSQDQMAWALEQTEKAHGLDFGRLLRDCVLGLVEAGRLDLMEALCASKSDGKAKRAVIRDVAQAYRVRQVAQQPFDALIQGLNKGEDPVALAAAEKAKAAFGDLDLVALAGGKIDNPAGLEEINALADNIAELLQQFRTEFKSMDGEIDMGKLRPVLDDVLKAVLQGNWPTQKYEDEVGVRQMAVLSPAQQAVWRQSTVVTADGPAPAADPGPALVEAQVLARGLAKKIPEQARLPKGVKFDAATVDRLRGELTAVVEQLRGAEKGTPQHRELSAKAGPLAEQLAIVEVQVALQGLGEEPDSKALGALLPLIPSGARALRKGGATGVAAALTDLGHAAEDMQPAAGTPGTGKWASDQDSLTAMIDSHKSGCLSKGDRRRRWGLAGSLSDANTKMIRVFNGDNQTYRTFVRMLPAKIGNYEGPCLFIENPRNDSGGNQEDLALLEKVLQEKARQMGVPAVGGQAKAPDGWKVMANAQLTLTFDPGHTGLYHSDRLGQLKKQNAQEPWPQNAHANVCVPPELVDKV